MKLSVGHPSRHELHDKGLELSSRGRETSSWALICDAMRIRGASLESMGLENFDGDRKPLYVKGAPLKGE